MTLGQKVQFRTVGQLIKSDKFNTLLLIAIWIFMVILVNPFGNFPLNDDWVYALSVKSILEKGDFRLPAFSSANVFSQSFWGAIFCLPFGFSFTALRFSTLTLGLIGVLATYGILRQLNALPWISLIGALLIAVNPIYFGLSNTFMTDVPFYALFVLSFHLIIRGLNKNSKHLIIFGLITSYIAILIRQFGIIISLVFGLAYLFKKGISLINLLKGFLPLLFGISIQYFYQYWLRVTDRFPPVSIPQYQEFFQGLDDGLFHTKALIMKIIQIFIYLGIFVFPFVIIFLLRKFKSSKKASLLLIFSCLVSEIMRISLWHHKQMPLLGNVLIDSGLGPLTLRDTFLLKSNFPLSPLALKIIWIVATDIGLVGAVLLFYYLSLAVIQIFTQKNTLDFPDKVWLKVLIISAIFIYVVLIQNSFLDRYLLPLLPLLMITILVSSKNIGKINVSYNMISIVLIVMIAYGCFTIAATHDYLEWNRARWQSLYDLMQKDHISPNHIDGGYEFNGWYLYNVNYMEKPGKSYWWVDNDDYIISSGPIPGYKEVKRYPFRRWLLSQNSSIFVLHKTAESDSTEP